MPELSEQQIQQALKAWTDLANSGFLNSRAVVLAVAPHLQYAPAPVDGDVIGEMVRIYRLSPHEPILAMQAAAQVLQSRHDTELAEYKKAMGPVTKKEWKVYRFGASVTVNERGFGDWLMAYRRAFLEKKPEPVDPLHGLTSKYMPETTKAVGLSLHDELIAEAFNRGRSEPKS